MLASLFAFAMMCTVAGAAEEKAEKGEWTGEVGCAHCSFKTAEKCAASFKVGEKVYTLTAAESADKALKTKLAKFKKQMKGEWTVKGTKTGDAIVADSASRAQKEGSKKKGG